LYAHIKELEKKLKLLEDKNKDGMDGKQIKWRNLQFITGQQLAVDI
jgi:hypothetical protein